jgi:hypothetical protein
MSLIKRLLALCCAILALLPRWGTFDVTSSLHVNTSGNDFTGLDALRHQSFTTLPLVCLVAFALLCFVIMSEIRISAFAFPFFNGWAKAIVVVFAVMLVMWGKILILTFLNERDRFFVSSIWYQEVTAAFWFFPCVRLLATVLVLLPNKRNLLTRQNT